MKYTKHISKQLWKTGVVCLLLLLGIGTEMMATHIIGGELRYTIMDDGRIQIHLTFFRECSAGETARDLDVPAYVGVYDSDGNLIRTLGRSGVVVLDDVDISLVDDKFGIPCRESIQDVCYERIYMCGLLEAPFREGGYDLVWQRCCRNSALTNIEDPLNAGMTLVAHVSEEAFQTNNSAALMGAWPPIYTCIDEHFERAMTATDVDGDELRYRLYTPNLGATEEDNRPIPPSDPPYAKVVWGSGYSEGDMMSGEEAFDIDPQTGVISATPGTVGLFLVGVAVEEYRNGELINTTTREYEIQVGECQNTVRPGFTYMQQCFGPVAFAYDTTDAANSWTWFFDWNGDRSLTSMEMNPIFEYDSAGSYTVAVIAEDTIDDCIDTLLVDIDLEVVDGAEIVATPSACVPLLYSFGIDLPVMIPADSILWDYGDGSDPSTEPFHFYQEEGTYTVRAVVNSPECMTEVEVDVVVESLELDFPDTIFFCLGDTQRITHGNTTDCEYLWTDTSLFEDPRIAEPIYLGDEEGYVYVNVMDPDYEDIAYLDSVYILFADSFDFGAGERLFCPGPPFSVNPDGNDQYEYLWSPGELFSDSTAVNPTVDIDADTVISVFLFDPITGCSMMYEVPLTISDNCADCKRPVLTVGRVLCEEEGTYQFDFITNADSVGVSAGTLDIENSRVTGIEIGTDVIIYAYNGELCIDTIIVSSLDACPIDCILPNLYVGEGICTGIGASTYLVSYIETTGASVSIEGGIDNGDGTATGTIGQDMIIRASNNMDPNCSVTLTVVSPTGCDDGCQDALISLSGPLCQDASQGSYVFNFVVADDVEVIVTEGEVDSDAGTIVISSGASVLISAIREGCDTSTVEVFIEEVALLDLDSLNTCSSYEETIRVMDAASFSQITWYAPDNSMLNGRTLTIDSSLTMTGWYRVEAIDGLCTFEDSVHITVVDTIEFDDEPRVICPGLPFEMNPDGNADYQYVWRPGDLFDDSTAVNPSLTVFTDTVIEVLISDARFDCSNTFEIEINLLDPGFELSYSADFDCGATRALLINTSGDTTVRIEWIYQDQVISASNQFTFDFGTYGTHEVTLRVYTDNGCIYDVVNAIVLSEFNPMLQDSVFACVTGDTIGLNPTGSDQFVYLWSGPGITNENQAAVNPIVVAAGNSEYTVIVTTADSSCADTQNVQLVLLDDFELLDLDSTGLCEDFEGTISVTNADAFESIVWTDPDGNVIEGSEIVLDRNLVRSGYYVCNVSTGTCEYIDSIFIDAREYRLDFASQGPYCENDTVVVNINDNSGHLIDEVQWEGDSNVVVIMTNANQAYVVVNGEGVVSGTLLYEDGCSLPFESELLSVQNLEGLDITISADTVVNGEEATISVIGAPDGSTFIWEPSEYIMSGQGTATITVNPPSSQTYTVTIMTPSGCEMTLSIELFVVDARCNNDSYFIPNAFTPNGDGVNDVWCVKSRIIPGTSIGDIESVFLIVYDRWGEEIFKAEGAPEEVCWDGTFKDEQLASDVYGFYARMTCIGGMLLEERGNVTILR